MNHRTFGPSGFASWGLLALSLIAPGCTTIPAELCVTGPEVGRVHAKGVQIYTRTEEAGKPAWKFKAPEATLDGDFKGKHYAGPTWEAADGSKAIGHKLAESEVGPDSIPWLLLDASGHEGKGRLSDVTFIQRLNTTGGKAPTISTAKAGEEVRVPYTADYIFFGPGAARTPAPK